MPRDVRSAFSALWNLDLAFADVVTTSTDADLGAIRMAWWRERLEELDQRKPAPAEPRLKAVASGLLLNGVTGKELSGLEDAWLPLLKPFPWSEAQVKALKVRGRILFGIGARLLGGQPAEAETAGALWSLTDAAKHCSDDASRALLRDEARKALTGCESVGARQLRPLTIIAALAAADLGRERSGLARLRVALVHQLMGRFPRS